MLTEDFYSIVDSELDEILIKYKDDSYIKKNRSAPNNQKSYALLIWFLDFYGKKSDYSNYITDGDDDSSCDIVFDSLDSQGNRVFYIVQSKWNVKSNCDKEVEKKDILQALNDFDTIIRGQKKLANPKLKQKLADLQVHLKANGEVKFIFLSLCRKNEKTDDNTSSFLESHRKTSFGFYDINRLKIDYIERKFKKIDPLNPLENHYNPEESKIELQVQRLNPASGNFIRVDKPFEAYVFLIKPKTIFELFEKFGFSLFFRNVRNPLMKSDFNREIEQTAIDNPAYFWYYNNGITAITYLLPEIRDEATLIEITGLQVINGAQTVYSIHKAYKEANATKRSIMDNEAVITLRLLKSGGKDFDLKVTRFTNSQNPVNDRDFRANDEVQLRLQNDFFNTPIWYEKRREEFREVPPGVKVISNDIFANCYLAYQLQDPVAVLSRYHGVKSPLKDLLFVSHRDDKDGLYERVFNDETTQEDFLVSYYLYTILLVGKDIEYFEESFFSDLYHTLALFKTAFTRYCQSKYGNDMNVNRHIRKLYESGSFLVIRQTLKYVHLFLKTALTPKDTGVDSVELNDLLTSSSLFEKTKGILEAMEMKPETIESIPLVEGENLVTRMIEG